MKTMLLLVAFVAGCSGAARSAQVEDPTDTNIEDGWTDSTDDTRTPPDATPSDTTASSEDSAMGADTPIEDTTKLDSAPDTTKADVGADALADARTTLTTTFPINTDSATDGFNSDNYALFLSGKSEMVKGKRFGGSGRVFDRFETELLVDTSEFTCAGGAALNVWLVGASGGGNSVPVMVKPGDKSIHAAADISIGALPVEPLELRVSGAIGISCGTLYVKASTFYVRVSP
jgi:hypothetical protein